jgi:pimeloyl-ACP methyl ester carboxylesterase
MSERVVFVHGAGRSGADAWPAQRSEPDLGDLVFLVRFGFGDGEDGQPTDFDDDRRRVVDALADGAHLVAHSYGAVAALMAAGSAPDRVRSVVLFEPACFSLARGRAAVEAHISEMSAALSDSTLTDEEFLSAFVRSVGGEPPPGPLSGAALDSARRLRVQRGPWEADLDRAVISAVPTLVVTSGESDLSEATAAALEGLGADRVVMPGTGHRPQDDPSANAVMRRFWAAASSGTAGTAARP